MEWTPAEFQAWAADAAKEFGYTVSTSLVGRPLGDAPAPTADSTAASQVAVFTLAAPDQPSRSPRSLVPASLPFFHPDGNTLPRHALVRRATLAALGAAGRPASDQELREEVRGLMGDWGRGELGLTELWPEMAEVAGGSRRALIRVGPLPLFLLRRRPALRVLTAAFSFPPAGPRRMGQRPSPGRADRLAPVDTGDVGPARPGRVHRLPRRARARRRQRQRRRAGVQHARATRPLARLFGRGGVAGAVCRRARGRG